MPDMLEIDRSTTALVVIDLQKGIAAMPAAPTDSKTIISNNKLLAAAFRARQMPVFLVHVAPVGAERLNPPADETWKRSGEMPPDWAEFVQEMTPQAGDIVITKKQWGAFYGTELDLQLRRRGIKTIVLTGIATNYGVESTARNAYEYGYSQIFPEDAMGSMSKEMHDASVNFVLKRIGQVRTTAQVLEALK